jgi:hypothetical protein
MRIFPLLNISLVLGLALNPISYPAQAVVFPDGRVSFDKSPVLIDAMTTFNSIEVWGATYYFTINLPDSAGEPLQKVIISQRRAQETINFYVNETVAFNGTQSNKQEKLNLQANYDEETGGIAVIFDPPIPPGTTFTVGLKPKRNPYFSGVYLFGVTVFPAGEKPLSLYLGVRSLSFYNLGNW